MTTLKDDERQWLLVHGIENMYTDPETGEQDVDAFEKLVGYLHYFLLTHLKQFAEEVGTALDGIYGEIDPECKSDDAIDCYNYCKNRLAAKVEAALRRREGGE